MGDEKNMLQANILAMRLGVSGFYYNGQTAFILMNLKIKGHLKYELIVKPIKVQTNLSVVDVLT